MGLGDGGRRADNIYSGQGGAALWPKIMRQYIDLYLSIIYLPNNTTVYTFAWVRFRRAGQQGPIRTLTAALMLQRRIRL